MIQKRPSRAMLIHESHIEQTCTEWLVLDGWRPLKTDPVKDARYGKGFGEPGMADYLYIRYEDFGWSGTLEEGYALDTKALAQVMWIEWKRPDGRHKKHQQSWQAAEMARGALVLRAGIDFEATIEDFQRRYLGSGLNRRMKDRRAMA